MSSGTSISKNRQAPSLQGVDPETCMIVFRTHWAQVLKILEKHDPLKNTQAKYGAISPDEASTVQNYVEHMLFLLIEEQAKDASMGPILEFVVSENIMEKLFLWSLRREFTDETKIEQLKMYEMLVTQSHQPLLHHKPILKPLMMLLSSCSGTATPTVETELVVLLNQLCSIIAKDPSILELFFHTSEDQGAANFLIFSLLIPFIHREGTVGQQARDALLFIMSLSAENNVVANHIAENTYFCPVLATGLSGLYSSLPTKLEEKGEEWHCLLKDDWLLSPALVQFMNSLEFCNAVIQVAHPLIRNQLVNYIYNGFLVPVMAPALHKVSDTSRSVKASPETAEIFFQKLRNKYEFTILVTLKQAYLNSGVILSIHHLDHRYLELESSGHRNEIRLHYRSGSHRSHTEVFPYILADDKWHRLSLAISASHLILHVDCNKIYERVVEKPFMDLPLGTTFWLGQRNNAHGYFKGIMQDVQLLVMPQGFISQCPDLNRTCPTCNDFHGLVQKIMELQDILAKTSTKLSQAEQRMNKLDQCYCERTCTTKGMTYREFESWTDGCKNCTCMNGTVQCEALICPLPDCPLNFALAYVDGKCCKECQSVCVFEGRTYFEGQRETVYSSSGDCVLFECKDRKMQRIPKDSCTALNCPESQQIPLSHSCCKICKGHDFCTEGHNCMEHSVCRNLDDRAVCSCRDGFRALREDNAYCEDIDECAEGRHYCRENTMCVNTPGSFMCICKTGYIRIDDYSCTEHDECITNQHNCDENALCFNTVGGHNCICKPGYTGNGTICKAFCKDGCRNGGACIASNVCACPQGFTGPSCETDIDECSDGFVQCDSRANCINLPGWYHCECRDGYHDNGMFSPRGESCEDIDECGTGRHSCANDTICFNLDGGYDCRCPHGKNCTGDCIHEDKIKHNGQIWVLENDRCSVCSCQSGYVMCRRMVCDCENPTVDLFCCPECDPRLSSQCLHQSGELSYNSGDSWIQNCQQCRCLQGEVDCWPLPCPEVDCEFSVLPENECCPRCVTDPCQADTIRNDITKTCLDETNVIRFTGSSWIKHGTECTLCQCKNGHVCCSVDPQCLQEL